MPKLKEKLFFSNYASKQRNLEWKSYTRYFFLPVWLLYKEKPGYFCNISCGVWDAPASPVKSHLWKGSGLEKPPEVWNVCLFYLNYAKPFIVQKAEKEQPLWWGFWYFLAVVKSDISHECLLLWYWNISACSFKQSKKDGGKLWKWKSFLELSVCVWEGRELVSFRKLWFRRKFISGSLSIPYFNKCTVTSLVYQCMPSWLRQGYVTSGKEAMGFNFLSSYGVLDFHYKLELGKSKRFSGLSVLLEL